MSLDTPDMALAAKPLCPRCGCRRMRITSSVPAQYDVAYDMNLDDFVVVGESLDEPDWDEASAVRCTTCGWTGRLSDIP